VRDWNFILSKKSLSFTFRVNRTCEGLKHKTYRTSLFFLKKCVNRTCEGLKQPNFYHCQSPPLVWIEPVRDWNIFHSNKIFLFLIQCESNLWGIETLENCQTAFGKCGRVNRTCEGLKLCFLNMKVVLNTGVNRTCEGLKRRIWFRIKIIFTHVWIEPVRDWNFSCWTQ